MKKLILITGTSFAIVNLLSFLIMSSYFINSFLIGEICIIISTALIHYVSISSIDNAFKISLLFLFSFLAVLKFILALFFKLPLNDNYVLLSIVMIVMVEFLFYFSLKYFTKHA